MRKSTNVKEITEDMSAGQKSYWRKKAERINVEKAEEIFAGYKITIQNHPKVYEYSYNIISTNGESLHTNDKSMFLQKIRDIVFKV